MGTDDLFKKSRAKRKLNKKNKNSRKSETTESLKRILIVSEGEKTEPLYFDYLKEFLKLTSINVEVSGSPKSCPKKVVEYGKELYDNSVQKGIAYDEIYCVIDKDTHAHYSNALSLISTYKKFNFFAINSVPCFELWLLLHYTYTTKPFSKTLNKSVCESLIKDELKIFLPEYEKNLSSLNQGDIDKIFNESVISEAIKRSKSILAYCKSASTDNPTTRIHELVEELFTLSKSKKELLK